MVGTQGIGCRYFTRDGLRQETSDDFPCSGPKATRDSIRYSTPDSARNRRITSPRSTTRVVIGCRHRRRRHGELNQERGRTPCVFSRGKSRAVCGILRLRDEDPAKIRFWSCEPVLDVFYLDRAEFKFIFAGRSDSFTRSRECHEILARFAARRRPGSVWGESAVPGGIAICCCRASRRQAVLCDPQTNPSASDAGRTLSWLVNPAT